jgi:hypothetical protein
MAGRAEIKCLGSLKHRADKSEHGVLFSNVSSMCGLFAFKYSKVIGGAIFHDGTKPSALFVNVCPNKFSAFLVGSWAMYVGDIFRAVALAQVGKSVVASNAVDVVNHVNRERTLDAKEYESVGSVILPFYFNSDVPTGVYAPGDVASLSVAGRGNSGEDASVRIVRYVFAKLRLAYKWLHCDSNSICLVRNKASRSPIFYHVTAIYGW